MEDPGPDVCSRGSAPEGVQTGGGRLPKPSAAGQAVWPPNCPHSPPDGSSSDAFGVWTGEVRAPDTHRWSWRWRVVGFCVADQVRFSEPGAGAAAVRKDHVTRRKTDPRSRVSGHLGRGERRRFDRPAMC